MMTLLKQMQDAVRARSEYRRTVDEIRRMPLDVALDLDIYQGDADRIARDAVYGR
ncbi:hypothetical protein [Roseitranquillus sediminis]|uniref:hypothetical protein n=1 Tax=Roseitranquillus sediminis TaxID=2809051 RepID=UPI001D0BF7FD|nr:hypothetical protein [Roseitranquillus sediminis]MBM9596037.1 hypothetical protein [Roseitranquillus sediminis]